jgi:hypothetical protein
LNRLGSMAHTRNHHTNPDSNFYPLPGVVEKRPLRRRRLTLRHAVYPSRVSVARACPTPLRCDRREDPRSNTTRSRRMGRCCNPGVGMTSPPVSLRIPALVLEPDRDAVPRKAPEALLQPVIELANPLASQEVPDGLAALEELVTVAPHRILRVGQRHFLGVAGVPGVLGGLDLLPRRLLVNGRDGGRICCAMFLLYLP